MSNLLYKESERNHKNNHKKFKEDDEHGGQNAVNSQV